jgi:hypothetical protein
MLVLTKNSSNTIRVSLAELSTLSNPVYLIEFISDTSLISTTCIAPDTSSYPARYNEFTITEQTSPDGLLAQILLEPVGFFTYNIYEQTSATNLAPNAPGTVLLETGKARVLIDGDRQSTAFSYYQNPTQDFHAWDVFASEGISPAPPPTDATYQNSDSSFTQVIAPGVTYTAPDISFTDSDGSVSNVPANTDVVCTLASDATYQNSDASFTQVIAPGATYIAPDISFTDSDGTVSNVPANTDIVATPCATLPIIYQRPIPTSVYTSYLTADDGWQYQNGTYTYENKVGNLASIDYSAVGNIGRVLSANNSFGNLNRFTDEFGTQTFASGYAIDHLTGLGWKIAIHGVGINWANSISGAAALTFATFSDWRVPNYQEQDSLFIYNTANTMNYSPFNINTSQRLWSSTTQPQNTANAIALFTLQGTSSAGQVKTSTLQSYMVCRNHYT